MACTVYLDKDDRYCEEFKKCIESINSDIEVEICKTALEVIHFVSIQEVEVVFVDMGLEDISCKELKEILTRIDSKIKLVLVSDKKEDAYDALWLDAMGFLLKPFQDEDVTQVLIKMSENLCTIPLQHFAKEKVIRMRTMPQFDMFVNGEPVFFKRKKGKELMALLVDADGGIVSSEQIIEALWEGEELGSSQRNRCRVLVNCLKNFLKGLEIDDLFEGKNGQYCVNASKYTSDLRDLMSGKISAGHFDGRYMEEYTWAEPRKGAIQRQIYDPK